MLRGLFVDSRWMGDEHEESREMKWGKGRGGDIIRRYETSTKQEAHSKK